MSTYVDILLASKDVVIRSRIRFSSTFTMHLALLLAAFDTAHSHERQQLD